MNVGVGIGEEKECGVGVCEGVELRNEVVTCETGGSLTLEKGESLPRDPEREPLDVAACVERVRAGDERSAEALVHHLHPLVVKIVRAHLPRRTAEEDLVQMVLTRVFTRLHQYEGRVPLEHWVSRVAVNTCLNELDRQRVRPEVRWADLSEEEEEVVKNLARDPGDLEPNDGLAARELVEKMIERLAPADQMVIRMLHLEGKSVAETCSLTGWSAPLVKVRAFRARQKMKKILGQLLAEGRDR